MRPLAFTAALLAPLAAPAAEPLPAGHDGAAKSAIIEFVEAAGPSFTQFAPRQKARASASIRCRGRKQRGG